MWLTVGYFEVTDGPALTNGQPNHLLGREYYREVPGDTRHKFFFIGDRSKVGMDAEGYLKYLQELAAGTPPRSGPRHTLTRPYFPTVEANTAIATDPLHITIYAPGGIVMSDGNPVLVGTTIVVGTGADRELVTVARGDPDTTPGATPGTWVLTLDALTP